MGARQNQINENLRLQEKYLPDLVKRYSTRPQGGGSQEECLEPLPMERLILCEDIASLLSAEDTKIVSLSQESPVWEELREIGSFPLRLQYAPRDVYLAFADGEAVLSGDICYWGNRFPIVLYQGQVARKRFSAHLSAAAIIYAVRPLSDVERRHLIPFQEKLVELPPSALLEALRKKPCVYQAASLLRDPEEKRLPGDTTLMNNRHPVRGFEKICKQLVESGDRKACEVLLLDLACDYFEASFFTDLKNTLESSRESIDVIFTQSYIAVDLFMRERYSFRRGYAAAAEASAKKIVCAGGHTEKQWLINHFLSGLYQNSRKRADSLYDRIKKEWRKIVWWE